MILSETEVQLGPDSGGIMVLPDSLEVGEEAGRYVTLGDDVLEFEVSPNRPDSMSVYGIARELHAVTERAARSRPRRRGRAGGGRRPRCRSCCR